ncbi:hypothetical protein T484DRAFT_1856181 [Baffinella frigidus]|nr:hypothetical protein T484DRAFT_1856181 [Cryptophyta sp. CCMP2293]
MVNAPNAASVSEQEGVRNEFAWFKQDVGLGVVELVGGHHGEGEEDDGTGDLLAEGQARVRWFSRAASGKLVQGSPVIESTKNLELVERAMLHHDIVAHRDDPLGQSGFVSSVAVECSVRFTLSGKVINGVNARSLRPLHPLRPGVYAVHGKWLGKVEEALDHVIVLWDDGSVCRMLDADPLYLLPHGASALSLAVDGESTYFPGVRVRVETGIRALDCMWLRDAPSRRSGLVYLPAVERVGVEVGVECGMQGVVVSVVAGRTAVRWIASSGEDPGEDAGQPRDVVARNLFPLSAFMHTWWRLGDYALLEPRYASDASASVSAPGSGSATGSARAAGSDQAGGGSAAVGGVARPASHAEAKPGDVFEPAGVQGGGSVRGGVFGDDRARCVELIETSSRVSVTWQNGHVQQGLRTKDLVHVSHMGAHDFWPDEFVMEKLLEDEDAPAAPPAPALEADAAAKFGRALGAGGGGGAGGHAGGGGGGGGGPAAAKAEALANGAPPEVMRKLERLRERLVEGVQTRMSRLDSQMMQERLLAESGVRFTALLLELLCADTPPPDVRMQRVLTAVLSSLAWSDLMTDTAVLRFLEKATDPGGGAHAGEASSTRRRFGVLRTVDCKERICVVEWFGFCQGDCSREVIGKEAKEEEEASRDAQGKLALPLGTAEVSVYEIMEHPEYHYNMGDVVIRLSNVAADGEEHAPGCLLARPGGRGIAAPPALLPSSAAADTRGDAEVPPSEARSASECRPGMPGQVPEEWVGELLEIKDGMLHVHWLEGTTCWVQPSEVWVVSGDEQGGWDDGHLQVGDDYDSGEEHEGSIAQVRAETEQTRAETDALRLEHSQLLDEKADLQERRAELEGRRAELVEEKAALEEKKAAREVKRAERAVAARAAGDGGTAEGASHGSAAGTLTDEEAGAGGKRKIASSTDTAAPRPAKTGRSSSAPPPDDQPSDGGQATTASPPGGGALHGGRAAGDARDGDGGGGGGGQAAAEQEGAGGGDEEEGTGAFEVLDMLAEHLLASHAVPGESRTFFKAVQREHKLLRSSLPPGILVRASEARMDLLRAVILGPSKTPYEDGVFVFDIHLPPEYPFVPPSPQP